MPSLGNQSYLTQHHFERHGTGFIRTVLCAESLLASEKIVVGISYTSKLQSRLFIIWILKNRATFCSLGLTPDQVC